MKKFLALAFLFSSISGMAMTEPLATWKSDDRKMDKVKMKKKQRASEDETMSERAGEGTKYSPREMKKERMRKERMKTKKEQWIEKNGQDYRRMNP